MGRIKTISLITVMALVSIKSTAQADASECNDMQWMHGFLKNRHFKEITIDSILVEGTIRRFFESFDYSGYYIDNAGRKKILEGKHLLQSDIQNGGCSFLDFLWKEVEGQEKRVFEVLNDDSFWAFQYDSTRVFASKGMSFNTMTERIEQWRKFVQMETLLNYINLTAALPSKEAYLSRFDSLKQSIRNTVDCRIKPSERSDVKKELYRAFLAGYDPYTEYFDKQEIELFLASMSSELKGVGFFVLKDFKGEYVITDVIKGSSADQNGIKKEDRLISMSRGVKSYNLFCYTDHEINQVLMEDERLPLSVVIRSTAGMDTVKLYSGHLESSAKAVQSYVLKGDRTIGYLSVPTFYYINESGGGSMAQDMALEIYKLKKQNIEGLIVGLHGNGGGSVEEAIELISLFIDDGDLFQTRNREGEPEKVKDPFRGMAYYGPLMVLVDGMSASASELVTMVLMEQGRALVVGDRTYGKSTAQQMMPLGGRMDVEPTELVKYTTSSWYNLHGKSLNEMGITPDIHVPTVVHERERGNPYTSIPSKWKARSRYFSMPIEELQMASRLRFAEDTVLAKRKQAIERMTRQMDFRSGMNVSYEKVAELYGTFRELDTEIPKISFEIEVVNPSDEDVENVKWLRKDLTLLEGYHIFADWLRLINK